MNLLLLSENDLVSNNAAVIHAADRRFKHLRTILSAEQGSELKVGLLNQKMGSGTIIESTPSQFKIEFELINAAPAPLPVKLVIALPRPKALLRVLQNATTLGVKEIYLLNAYRVEKAFWSCEQIKPHSIEKSILLGLEQARDTQTPQVHLEKRFKPFVEDRLAEIAAGTQKVVAHPSADAQIPVTFQGPHTIVIGPEGGFIPYEVEMLKKQGFEAISLGPRILRSETAMVTILARVCS